jgi:hypothetical protein
MGTDSQTYPRVGSKPLVGDWDLLRRAGTRTNASPSREATG